MRVLALSLVVLLSPLESARAQVPFVEATAEACRLDLRIDGTGAVLVAERRGGVYVDVHADGEHVAGDVDLMFGFMHYSDVVPGEPGAGVTRVAFDAEKLLGLATAGPVSLTLPSGSHTEIDVEGAERVVGELLACARLPAAAPWTPGRLPPGSEWVERVFPRPVVVDWSFEAGPGDLICVLTAPLPGGGRVSIVDRPAPASATLVIERDDIVPVGEDIRFLFPGGWGTQTFGRVEHGLAAIDLPPESEARVGLAIFGSVTVVIGEVSVSFAPSFSEAQIAARDRCLERMRRWE